MLETHHDADSDATVAESAPAGHKESRPHVSRKRTDISLEDQAVRLSNAKLLLVFAGLSSCIMFAFADQVMVATAEPVIGKDLNAGASISWVGTSYL